MNKLAEVRRLEEWSIAISFGEVISLSAESKIRRRDKLMHLVTYWLSEEAAEKSYQRKYARQFHVNLESIL